MGERQKRQTRKKNALKFAFLLVSWWFLPLLDDEWRIPEMEIE
jgi:hypothetical protein